MDTIRRGFVTEMYLWGPDQPPVPVRWHRASKIAKNFPGPHIWHSITWQQQGGHNERIDLLGPRGAYDKGKDHVGYRGAEFHGPLRYFLEPAVMGEAEELTTGADGSIPECRPVIAHHKWTNKSGGDNLGSVQGTFGVHEAGIVTFVGIALHADADIFIDPPVFNREFVNVHPEAQLVYGLWSRVWQSGDPSFLTWDWPGNFRACQFNYQFQPGVVPGSFSVVEGVGDEFEHPGISIPADEFTRVVAFVWHDGDNTTLSIPIGFNQGQTTLGANQCHAFYSDPLLGPDTGVIKGKFGSSRSWAMCVFPVHVT